MDSSEYHDASCNLSTFPRKLSLPNPINPKSQSESESEFSVSDMDGNAVPGFKRADMRPCGYQVEKIRTVGKSTPAEMVYTTIYNTYI